LHFSDESLAKASLHRREPGSLDGDEVMIMRVAVPL
jgi:hypothetical protein